MLGIGKNKGGVALAMKLRNTPLCFINSHLAAHQDKVIQRNQDVRNILRSTRLGSTMCELTTQYHTIWMGDLNYRIDKHTRKEAVRLVEANPDPDPNPNPNPNLYRNLYPNPDLHLNPSNPAGAMLLECEGDDAALAELGITSRLAVNKLRSSLRALAARR